jgi:hypothetical protein
MSYSLADGFWRQRIRQELNRAAQFRRTHESFYRSPTSTTSTKSIYGTPKLANASVEQKRPLLNSMTTTRLGKRQDEVNYKNTRVNLAYTFGGTMSSRSAFRDQGSEVVVNPSVRSRPGTSMTHKRISFGRTSSAKSLGIKDPVSQDEPLVHVDLAEALKQTSLTMARSEASSSQTTAESPVKLAEEEVVKADFLRPQTSSTYRSSGSQRSYIRSLQEMLNEEKRAREALELKLEAFISKHEDK